jgi:hypothetical protein
MTSYRLYLLDQAGRIAKADVLEAATDDEAIRRATEFDRNMLSFEIWDLTRRVHPPVTPANK